MKKNNLLHRQFQQQVENYPNAIALTFNGEAMSYADLNARSNQLAGHLQTLGVKPEVLVGLCLERNFNLIIAILAILKAGGAYLPLDSNAPMERLEFILKDSETKIVLTESQFAIKFTAVEHLINLNAVQTQIHRDYSEQNIVIDYAGDATQSLCYLMYTSGSTGLPKGVQITHHNVMRLLDSTEAWFNFNSHDVWVLFHSYAFDMSVWEIWGAFLYGGRLVIAPHTITRTPEQFYQLLVDEKITFLNQTPSAFAPLVRVDQDYPADALSLRCVTFGGEALNFKMLEPWLLRHGDSVPRLVNMYGITETTVHASYRLVTLQDIREGNSKLIGVAIPDLELHLLDDTQQIVPNNIEGEIYVAGDGVARGYLNRPELNSERFITLPQFPNQRLYRSGDLAIRLANGDMEYVGRADTQIKLRGFRIELGEIETILTSHEKISEAVVTVHEEDEHKRLVAYVVAKNPTGELVSQLRELAAAHLPEYMHPTYYTVLEKMPLNVNGKIDCKALPEPQRDFLSDGAHFVAPQTPAEKTLAILWVEVLKLEKVSIHDNFFQMGGDSILAIQLISKAKCAGLKLAPNQLFLHQTIAELGAQAGATNLSTQLIIEHIAKQNADSAISLSPVQHWFFEQKITQPQHWNQAVLLKCRQTLPADLIEKSLQALQNHHSCLRYQFINQPDSLIPEQRLNPDCKPIRLNKIDLTDFPEAERTNLLIEIAEQAQGDLNLQRGILMKALLFQLAENEQRLLIIVHHLLVDGVSWRILLEDLETAFKQLEQGLAVHLLASATFAEWTHVLQNYSQQIVATEIPNFDGKPFVFVGDFNGENTSGSAKTHTLILNEAQTEMVLRAKNGRIQDILLTALVLSLRGENENVLLDLEGHGREAISDLDISRTCGWFTSIFPFAVNAKGEANDVLNHVKQVLATLPQNGLDFGILRYLKHLSPAEKSHIVFNYLGQFDQLFSSTGLFELAEEDYGSTHSPKGLRPYLLEINALVYQGKLKIDFVYSENVHKHETIEALAQTFQAAIDNFTTGDFSLADLSASDTRHLQTHYPELEACYPLSPTQEGMLFHALSDNSADVYFEQFSYDFEGVMNFELFQQAWRVAQQQHSILRTAVVWKGLTRPLQIVSKQTTLPWQNLDWRDVAAENIEQNWLQFVSADRTVLFELNQPPLMRWTLVLMPNDGWRLLWTHSHILLDGWSVAVCLKDVLQIYASLLADESPKLPAVAQYRDYIAWLESQNPQHAERFWYETLNEANTRVGRFESTGQQGYVESVEQLPETDCVALQHLAQQFGVTLNTLLQAAWALVVAEFTQNDEIMFGITVSGRANDLENIEMIAGLFINTLPLHLKLERNTRLSDWLKAIQTKQFTLQQFEYSSLADIKKWSRTSVEFDSIFIFENYPIDEVLLDANQPLRVHSVKAFEHNNYPLTLLAMPHEGLCLQMTYNAALFTAETIQHYLQQVIRHLKMMSVESTLADFYQPTTTTENAGFLQSMMDLDEDF